MNKISFISYPSSGSYWLSHIIRNVFNTQIHLDLNDCDIFRDPIEKQDDLEIRKFHCNEENHQKYIEACSGLILIIRSYKECTIKRLKVHGTTDNLLERIQKELSNKSYEIKDERGFSVDYIRLLNVFHNFKGKKLLIFYEDLITDLPKELHKIKDFFSQFGISGDTENFMENLEEHKQQSLNNYKNRIYGQGGTTRGNNVSFHSNLLSAEELKKLDAYVESTYPNLFKAYLQRYKEQQ